MTGGVYYLVGEAPNPATVGRPRLWLAPDSTSIKHAANRLRDYGGLTTREFLRVFPWRTNVWLVPGERPIAVGRARARTIAEQAVQWGADGIVVLGTPAARAFGILYAEELTWTRTTAGDPDQPMPRVRAARVPHPSGRCYWWNDALNRVRARAFLRGLLEGPRDESTGADPGRSEPGAGAGLPLLPKVPPSAPGSAPLSSSS